MSHVLYTSNILGTNGLYSADVPLSNKQTDLTRTKTGTNVSSTRI